MNIFSCLWQDIFRPKYFKRDTIASVKGKFFKSPIWKDLLKVKEFYMLAGVTVRSRDVARLCKESWDIMLPYMRNSLN